MVTSIENILKLAINMHSVMIPSASMQQKQVWPGMCSCTEETRHKLGTIIIKCVKNTATNKTIQ